MKNVCIIPARGGSKGIPGKNIKPLAGKPLLAHSIEDALEAESVDEVYVSTDDPDIAAVADTYGAKVIMRPAELSGDSASSESALSHVLQELEKNLTSPALVVFLQCTSPIRSGSDIDRAVAQFLVDRADSLLSVSPSHRFLWENTDGIAKPINYDFTRRLPRQEFPAQFVENGSIYLFRPWVLKALGNRLGGKISMYVMSEEASWDIDSPVDFEIVDFLMNRGFIYDH